MHSRPSRIGCLKDTSLRSKLKNTRLLSGDALARLAFVASSPQFTIASDGSGDYFIDIQATPNLTYRLQRTHSLTFR